MATPDKFETAFDTYSRSGTIGEGGAGRVFEVTNSAGKTFALKCLRPELVTSDKRKRFKNEIDFCSRNEHPNLIRIVDSGVVEWDGKKTPFYVMPRYAGTLRGLMEKHIAADTVLKVFGQILDGVEAAHLRGVWHRDLKPENILHDPSSGLFVVADLGIAHFEEEILATQVKTKKNDKLLNIGYSAPEQRAKGAAVDHRADIYALGQILNEMFTGVVPEGAGHAIVATAAPQLAYLDPLIEKMRQQNPAARPATIEEVKKELIGRKNEFIALQQLDAKKKQVIQAASPSSVVPVKIVDVDWTPEDNQLKIKLNRDPESGWRECFRNPNRSFGYKHGIGPNSFQFYGPLAVATAEEHQTQDAVDQFDKFAQWATQRFQEVVNKNAMEQEQKRRKELELEVAAAEAKARVKKTLKF